MAQFLAPIINEQQFDANGDPLSGGTIEVYLAGTSTPAATTSDKAGLIPNSWPIVLDTLGVNSQGEVWITGGSAYKFIIKNDAGVTQRTIDNVSGINDNTIVVDQWVVYQAPPTFVSATSFTVAGDQTQTFQPGRRLKTTNTGGTVYSTIAASTYLAPNTTVTVVNDSGVLDSGLSVVAYGVISAQSTSAPAIGNFGQCRLQKSGANLVLSRYQGNLLTINGVAQTIPAAGVSLAPGVAVANTLYYIYAYMSTGVMTLEFSTTGHSTDATTGVEIKTGDATRTLVGMARPTAGPVWVDSATQRFVISWFNRRRVNMYLQSSGALSTALGTPQSLLSLTFLAWNDENLLFGTNGTQSNNTINSVNGNSLGVDSTSAAFVPSNRQAFAANAAMAAVASYSLGALSEGFHTVNALGWVVSGGGTASWAAPNGFELTGSVVV